MLRQTMGAVAVLACVGLVGCPGTDPKLNLAGGTDTPGSCKVILDQMNTTQANLEAGFDYALIEAKGKGSYQNLQETKTGFDSLQKDFNLSTAALCEDFDQGRVTPQEYSRRRYCLERRLTTLRTMELVLKNNSGQDPDRLTWDVNNKLDYLIQTSTCEEQARTTPEAFDDAPQEGVGGLKITKGGAVDGGALNLNTQGQPFQSQPLTLRASLICERLQNGAYVPVPDCEGTTLTENDRFKVALSSSTPAYLYFYLYNGTGQFQMFFPPPGVPNQAKAGVDYFLPPGQGWVVLDNVGGTYEHLQVVASTYPIRELEELRGADIPPAAPGKLGEVAARTRGRIEPVITRSGTPKDETLVTQGRIEPVITRGGKVQGAPMTLEEQGAPRTSVPTVVETRDIAAVEFEFFHR